MQLNIHVPKDREAVVDHLNLLLRSRGMSKNQVVLDAVELYLARELAEAAPTGALPVFDMGAVQPWRRSDLYDTNP